MLRGDGVCAGVAIEGGSGSGVEPSGVDHVAEEAGGTGAGFVNEGAGRDVFLIRPRALLFELVDEFDIGEGGVEVLDDAGEGIGEVLGLADFRGEIGGFELDEVDEGGLHFAVDARVGGIAVGVGALPAVVVMR